MRRISKYSRKDKPIQIRVSPNFYKQFDDIRKQLELKMGNIPLSQPDVSNIILKGGLNIPKNMEEFFNDKKQKSRRY